jgi:hypothetical protein
MGGDSMSVWWSTEVAIDQIDLTCYVPEDGVTIRHGRFNSTEQPQPNSAVFSLVNLPTEANRLLEVGLPVVVNVGSTALEGAAWHVDASALNTAGDGLQDLSGGGRDAMFGAGAAPVVLPWSGEGYVWRPLDNGNQYVQCPSLPVPLDSVVTFDVARDPGIGGTAHVIQVVAGAPADTVGISFVGDDLYVRFADGAALNDAVWSGAVLTARHSWRVALDTGGAEVFRDGTSLGYVATGHTRTTEPDSDRNVFQTSGTIAGAVMRWYSFGVSTGDGTPLLDLQPNRYDQRADQIPNTGGTVVGVFRPIRAANGLKLAVVDRPLLALGGAHYLESAAPVQAAEITVLSAWRVFGNADEQQTWIDLANGVSGPGRVLTYRTGPASAGTRATAYLTGESPASDMDSGSGTLDGLRVFGGVVSRTSVAAVLDGVTGTPTDFGVAPPAEFGRAEGFSIGTQWGRTQFTDGEFVAAVIFDRALTSGEVAAASEALASFGRERRRYFTGVISDVESTVAPDGGSVNRIVAVSSGLGAMARNVIGDEPWETERDGPRIERIIDLAGVPKGTVDPGTVAFNARDIDAQDAAALATAYAAQAFGYLLDGRDGTVAYQDRSHRDPATDPIVEIPCSVLLSEPVAGQRVAAVTNRVRIRYGPEPQAQYTTEDSDSLGKYGLY